MVQLATRVFAQVPCSCRLSCFVYSIIQICFFQPSEARRIPVPFTSRRTYDRNKAAMLIELLRSRGFSRQPSPEHRVSSLSGPAVDPDNARSFNCSDSHKHGIV
jgi:hypothetical protein